MFPERWSVSGLSLTDTEIPSPSAVTVIHSLAASSGAAVHVSSGLLTVTATRCASAPSPAKVRDSGLTVMEPPGCTPSPASCCTVMPMGLISIWSTALTDTVPERFSAVGLSVTEMSSDFPSSPSEAESHSCAAPDTSCVHSVFVAVTATLWLPLPVAANSNNVGCTESDAAVSTGSFPQETAATASGRSIIHRE